MTCGAQFAPSTTPPSRCDVCEDERQYVGWSGQQWGALDELQRDHINEIREDLGLTGIGTKPSFAIGQRALLVRSPAGNLLWDCITLIDDATATSIRELGGMRAIAISHPHYYSSMVEWSRCFNAPIYLHAAAEGKGALLAGDILQVAQDRRWVSFMYSYPNYIPLAASEIDRIVAAVEPFDFDRIYGAWWDRNVESDAKAAVRRSAERYKRALGG